MRTISYKQLPKKALAAFSKRQRTYIDEFVFRQHKDGTIDAYYGGDFIGSFDGKKWWVVSYLLQDYPIRI